MIQRIIRWILTAGLIVGVYFETGIFTTVSIALIFIMSEVAAHKIRGLL